MKRQHALQKGFNSDVVYCGQNYHVQTEDWGSERGEFVTQVFSSGAVIKTIRIPYTKVLVAGFSEPDQIKIAVETQHQSVVELLISGQLIHS
jgi:hypothetical protein